MTKRLCLLRQTIALLAAALVLISANPGLARDRNLVALARAAEGDTLVLVVHGVEGHEATVREFQRRFPKVNVQVTVQNPSSIAPRIVTEQQNGIYSWDSWWAASTAMNNIVVPAHGFAPITDFLVLPDIRDTALWYAPEYRYTSNAGPYVFLHSMHVETGIMFNSDVVDGFELRTAKDLLDPRLKGRIAMRDPSAGTTNGSYVLAQLLREEGPEFIRRLKLEQEPAIIENGRQVTDAVLRGDYAVSLGSSPDILSRCHKMGGCRSVHAVPIAQVMSTRGVGVLKNPPHPAATRLWVNWLLSQEGQEVYVREWAKDQAAGASSLRRDVAPDPKQLGSIPDYDNLEIYGLYGMEAGRKDLTAANELFARLHERMEMRPSPSARVVALLALAGIILLSVRTLIARVGSTKRRWAVVQAGAGSGLGA